MLQLTSFLVPRNGNNFYLLEDSYLKGGFRVVADNVERDNINPVSKKAGMLVYVLSTRLMWQLDAALAWTAFSFAQAYNPFYTHKQIIASSRWQIFHARNCRYFHAQTFASDGRSIWPDEITILDSNSIQLDFSIPLTGHCTLSFDQISI